MKKRTKKFLEDGAEFKKVNRGRSEGGGEERGTCAEEEKDGPMV